MNNLRMFCLTMNANHLNFIKEINYIPVGLGTDNFSKEYFRDNTGLNITEKNSYYGEYTFHYWIWKNYLNKLDDGWIGFCQYRKFWSQNDNKDEHININNIKTKVLKEIPKELEEYESILNSETTKNEWYKNLKITQFTNNLKAKVEENKFFFK